MKLSVTHRTTFFYNAPVRESNNTIHLEPRHFRTQKTLRSLIRIIPPTRLVRFTDLFQNIAHHFEISQAHQRLVVESQVRVENHAMLVPPESAAITYQNALPHWRHEEAWMFLQESHHVSKHPTLWRTAIDTIAGISQIHHQALALMSWVHQNFTYSPGVTHVNTHLEEALELRQGVCQDYAHVLIGLCRAVGIPARYVSGYLYNGPKDHLIGSQASHAWVEVHLPHAGWIGYDPTNNTLTDERFVKIAVGRDYQDVAPIQGRYFGGAHCQLEVEVIVKSLDSTSS